MPISKSSKPTKISVIVKPGSKKGPLIVENVDKSLTIFVRERAINSKANAAVIELLADYLNTQKTSLKIVSGNTSRCKIVSVL